MNWNRFAYKMHKWTAVGAVLFTFMWFVSGIELVLPNPLFRGGGPASTRTAEQVPKPDYRDIRVSLPEAIATAEAVAGNPVRVAEVRYQRLLGRLVYVIGAADASTYLIDTVTGEHIAVDEPMARAIANSRAGPGASVRQMEWIEVHDPYYPVGPLPAYRFTLDDAAGTWVHVSARTGGSQAITRRGRVRRFIGSTHTLGFLRPVTSQRTRRIWLLFFSVVGTGMTLFGSWILWLQFSGWLRTKKAQEK